MALPWTYNSVLSSSLAGIIEAPTAFDALHVYVPESLPVVGSIVRTLVTANTSPFGVVYSRASVSVMLTRERRTSLSLWSPMNQLMTGAGIPVALHVNVAESDWFTVSNGEGTRNWTSEKTDKSTLSEQKVGNIYQYTYRAS